MCVCVCVCVCVCRDLGLKVILKNCIQMYYSIVKVLSAFFSVLNKGMIMA